MGYLDPRYVDAYILQSEVEIYSAMPLSYFLSHATNAKEDASNGIMTKK